MSATLLADRYRLGARIGTGASARVFEAHDERLDRSVAVKVLDDAAAMTADPAARQRFEVIVVPFITAVGGSPCTSSGGWSGL